MRLLGSNFYYYIPSTCVWLSEEWRISDFEDHRVIRKLLPQTSSCPPVHSLTATSGSSCPGHSLAPHTYCAPELTSPALPHRGPRPTLPLSLGSLPPSLPVYVTPSSVLGERSCDQLWIQRPGPFRIHHYYRLRVLGRAREVEFTGLGTQKPPCIYWCQRDNHCGTHEAMKLLWSIAHCNDGIPVP